LIAGDASMFINLKMRQEGFVTYGDNNKGRILGRGDVESHDSIIIKAVLLVDGLKHNLLSISQLCDKGYIQSRLVPHIKSINSSNLAYW